MATTRTMLEPVPILGLTLRQFIGGKSIRIVFFFSLVPAIFALIYMLETGDTTAREFMEELGLAVLVREKIASIRHAYTTFRVTLHAFFCERAEAGEAPSLPAAGRARWVAPGELARYPFPAANARLIALLNGGAAPPAERSPKGCVP